MNGWWRTALLVEVCLLSILGPPTPLSAESLVVNGDFQAWTEGVPEGWTLEIGARNGAEQPTSEVKVIAGPALMLRGNADTMAWHAVGQKIVARPEGNFRLTFESRTKDIQQEGRQYDNCYVGLVMSDASGKVIDQQTLDVSGDVRNWTRHQLDFIVPEGAVSTKVIIFLSKSGLLAVRRVEVVSLDASYVGGVADDTSVTSLVTNGDFSQWTDGLPADWTAAVGANNGADDPKSEITRLGDAGVVLRGNADTMAWQNLSQKLPVEPGRTYTLTFLAQTKDIRQEGRQFDNCYVGVMSLDAQGKRLDLTVEDLSIVRNWKTQRLHFRVPPQAAEVQLLIFLSKSGVLMVRNVRVQEVAPENSFRGPRR